MLHDMSGERQVLHRRFLGAVERHGGRRALEVGGHHLTYAELGARATGIAAAIQAHRPAQGRTAILAQRSLTAYEAVLGALLAGDAYVPLHPAFPVERNRLMLARSGARTIVADEPSVPHLAEILEGVPEVSLVLVAGPVAQVATELPGRTVVALDDVREAGGRWLEPEVREDDLAYLLFTSGSTGQPKGVGISHGNADAYLRSAVSRYGLRPDDRISQAFELTFDVSVFDLFATWSAGACLCVPERRALLKPGRFIAESRLSVWYAVPSVSAFMRRFGDLKPGRFPDLRLVMFVGEALPVAIVEAWRQAAPSAALVNTYGPTEATVAVTDYWWDDESSPAEVEGGVVPIGFAYDEVELMVVDDELCEVEVGDVGELLLAGPQVGPGYWGDAARTRSSFPTGLERPGRWYRTGDRVRRPGPGQALTFLGRRDSQVKISGYRVELGEIEAAIRDAAGTDEVVVVAWPVEAFAARGIVAFVGSESVDATAIRDALGTRLPSYMLPGTITVMPALPRNGSGKLDRSALAETLEVPA